MRRVHYFILLSLVHWFYASLALADATNRSITTELRVQLDWKHQYEFAAFYAAKAKGFYADQGLNVTILEGGPGISPVDVLLHGDADAAVTTSGVIVDRAQGKPVVALAALMQHSPVALLVLRQPGLNSVHDLANRPVAVDAHNRDEIEAYLLASGLPKSSIHFITQTSWTLNELDKGTFAAKVIYTLNEPFLIRDQLHRYLLFSPRSAGIDLFGNLLITSEQMLKQKPEAIKAFKQATLLGLSYALAHPDEISDLILQEYNTQAKSKEHLLYEAEQIRELTRPDIVEPGYMSMGRWRHVVDVYADQGKVPADLSLAHFIYDDSVPETHIPRWLFALVLATIVGLLLALWLLKRVRAYNICLQQEIEQKEAAQRALIQSEANYRELVSNANVIILRIDFLGHITYFNPFAQVFFGYEESEILGKHVLDTIVPSVESETQRDLTAMVDAILVHPENYMVNENENVTKKGERVWVHWINRVLFDEQGQPSGVLSIGQDMTERRRAEEKIHQLAFYDALTGLANRRLMLEQLRQSVLQHQHSGHYGALMFIDLDHFKWLNDTQGHDMGDQLLVLVAQRLQQAVRQEDSVARLGGDEFIVMLDDLGIDESQATREAERMANRVLSILSEPYVLKGELYHLTSSIGVALFKDQYSDSDELLKRADLAMYDAKSAGRNRLRFFNTE